MPDGPRILILDIETFPQYQLRWRYWEDGAAFHTLKPNTVAAIAYRWVGGKKSNVISLNQTPGYKRPGSLEAFLTAETTDQWQMEKIWEVVVEADFVVAHYGLGFDRPMMEARLWEHGLGPFPPGNWIDSKKEISKFLRGSGYSMALGNLAEWLDLAKKLETNKSLWLRCMSGEAKAWREMRSYAAQDVDTLHDLFLSAGPFMRSPVFNMGHWNPGETVCIWCGSSDLEKRGFYYTTASKFQRYLCRNCGHWPRSSKREPQSEALGTNVPLR